MEQNFCCRSKHGIEIITHSTIYLLYNRNWLFLKKTKTIGCILDQGFVQIADIKTENGTLNGGCCRQDWWLLFISSGLQFLLRLQTKS